MNSHSTFESKKGMAIHCHPFKKLSNNYDLYNRLPNYDIKEDLNCFRSQLHSYENPFFRPYHIYHHIRWLHYCNTNTTIKLWQRHLKLIFYFNHFSIIPNYDAFQV